MYIHTYIYPCMNESKQVLHSVPVAKECELECQNGGSVNNNTCTCECPEGYTGEQCESK